MPAHHDALLRPISVRSMLPVGAALVLAAAGACGQDAGTGGDEDGAAARSVGPSVGRAGPPPVTFFVSGGGVYSGASELDGTNAEVSVARLEASAGISLRAGSSSEWVFRLGNEFSFYEFEDGAGIVPGMPAVDEPFDSVRSTSVSALYRSAPETGWQWTVGGRVASNGEAGADFGDTLVGGGFVLASYDISENLRLGAGVSVSSRLEGGVFVFPIPVIEWDITDSLRLGTTERGVGLSYAIDRSWRVGVDVGFMRREFRLADDNAIADGSFTDSRVPVTLAVTYAPSPKTVITARIGSEVWGDLEFNDGNENEIASYDLSPTLLVGLDVRLAF